MRLLTAVKCWWVLTTTLVEMSSYICKQWMKNVFHCALKMLSSERCEREHANYFRKGIWYSSSNQNVFHVSYSRWKLYHILCQLNIGGSGAPGNQIEPFWSHWLTYSQWIFQNSVKRAGHLFAIDRYKGYNSLWKLRIEKISSTSRYVIHYCLCLMSSMFYCIQSTKSRKDNS